MQAQQSLTLRWRSLLRDSCNIVTVIVVYKGIQIMIMGVCHCRVLELSKMKEQKSLPHGWRSFLGGGRDIFACLCVHQGGQYFDYSLTLLSSPVIVQDARPEISNALLTVISRMGQQAYRLPFYIWIQPVTPIWIEVTIQPVDCCNDQPEVVDAPLTFTFETY
jgi:hypothetical protein